MNTSLRKLFGVFTPQAAQSTILHDRESRKRINAVSLVARLRNFDSLPYLRSLEDMATLMNDYYSSIAEVVLSTNGDIDSFSGATIVGFYYEQRFETHRSLAGALCTRLDSVVRSFKERYEVGIGVGLCTGALLYGSYGYAVRRCITAFGEPVACASQLADGETHINICNRLGLAEGDLTAGAPSAACVVSHWHPPNH